ncbi:ABC transporter permease [Luethyella okanaganae]|uniref:ABC transporter permease n=1 Tax=Luethyella okanaganae TaxID=69372 RepID=A0ABW1VFE8_9MICO
MTVQIERRGAAAETSRPSALLLTVSILIAAVTLVPVGFVVITTVQTGWDVLAPLIFRPKVGELLLNTILLVVIGVPLCVAAGVGAAWLVERTNLPGRRFWAILFAAPLAIPAFVSSYAWVSLLPSIGGLGGGLLISTLAYSPLVYFPAAATLRGLDPALEDSARSLGLTTPRIFVRVVLPQLRLAIWGGGLIVALHLLAEYGAFALIRFDTFTTAIIVQYQSTFAGPAASALGIVLTLLCLLVLTAEATTRGRARYAHIGSGAPLPPERHRLGRGTAAAVLATILYTALAIGVPLLSIGRWLGVGEPWAQPEIGPALMQTVFFVVCGAVLTVAAALPLAWLSIRHPGSASRLVENSTYVASSLPGIVIALALVTVTIRLVPELYQTVATVLLAYLIMFLPRALVTLRAGLGQAPIILEEVARSLGDPPVIARLRVTVPLLTPSLWGGAALVGLGVANELTATLLLAPNGTRTLATQFWSASSSVAYADAAPYALLLIVISVPTVALMSIPSQKRTTL